MLNVEKKFFLQIFGIIGICILIYLISNHSINILLNIFNQEKPNVSIVFLNRILMWGGLLLFFIHVKYNLKEKFLPWKEKKLSIWKSLLSVIGILIILFVGFLGLILLIQYMDFATSMEGTNEVRRLTLQNIPLMIFTCFTAAVLEEILFRGYIFPAISEMTNSIPLGIVISSILFGLVHISYGTVHQVIIPIYFGLVFSTFYTKYRNLKVIIFCHFIWNFVAYLDSANLL